ncbi:hypothetical protein GCM10011332_21470 [Terasakiella brassicae]|uniref:Uncharacterized protein n=1 Tax=Terasakiella brassicae TaxID=1634917 RepID=A0A917FDA2_9PROT|nr:hypothetical protein [Terasakiella brassicae]GGF67070.1 hypothetical protein GCM10011332_21470 [Terasakiella brassicae]
MSRLIITNGDSTAQRIADIVLPWRDVLHEGPALSCDNMYVFDRKGDKIIRAVRPSQ